MNNIHTTNDFMIAIAEAIDSQDEQFLAEIEETVSGWLVDSDERNAMNTLIDIARSVIS